jgi:hypothetical protein
VRYWLRRMSALHATALPPYRRAVQCTHRTPVSAPNWFAGHLEADADDRRRDETGNNQVYVPNRLLMRPQHAPSYRL